MTKSEQLRMEKYKKVEGRRKFAKLRKKIGIFGRPFAKSKLLGGY